MDPHCFDADPDPAQNLDTDPDPDPGGGVGQPKMCIPPGKILGTPLVITNTLSAPTKQIFWDFGKISIGIIVFWLKLFLGAFFPQGQI